MRNLYWMLVSGAAVVIAIGGAVYYLFPKQAATNPIPNMPQAPTTESRVLVVPNGNPLLTADKSQFRQWLPAYCGADIFMQASPEPHKVDVCVNGTISRVAGATGVKLTRADVLDPRVKAHWREVMGAR
ncbi:hypothetical protein ACI2T9_23230 [Ralstonia nicotianae]|uniref:hypothetical protein n=1 Tax=Ralstonia pseudosolanacearum TaxID=1310165 RepID=UPI0014020C66|nr:hypothetical protein [Ralstonia pseudosolanacearum]KAF3458076.1 hypothetical protein GO278_005180 [Ralstonia solanacearum]NKA81506.1 hypothetical protein [Ralstonia solanacearum]NKG02227.1 hypothetical protein [Ralstonia solanacearum]UNJ33208.1 hypothetical protein MNY32_26270 [Ralstonia pseudosolanacearum]